MKPEETEPSFSDQYQKDLTGLAAMLGAYNKGWAWTDESPGQAGNFWGIPELSSGFQEKLVRAQRLKADYEVRFPDEIEHKRRYRLWIGSPVEANRAVKVVAKGTDKLYSRLAPAILANATRIGIVQAKETWAPGLLPSSDDLLTLFRTATGRFSANEMNAILPERYTRGGLIEPAQVQTEALYRLGGKAETVALVRSSAEWSWPFMFDLIKADYLDALVPYLNPVLAEEGGRWVVATTAHLDSTQRLPRNLLAGEWWIAVALPDIILPRQLRAGNDR